MLINIGICLCIFFSRLWRKTPGRRKRGCTCYIERGADTCAKIVTIPGRGQAWHVPAVPPLVKMTVPPEQHQPRLEVAVTCVGLIVDPVRGVSASLVSLNACGKGSLTEGSVDRPFESLLLRLLPSFFYYNK